MTDDPQFRTVLRNGPGAFDEASALLSEIKPTLPVLLANLTTIGQILVLYHASIEQLLVILPPDVAGIQAVAPSKNQTGWALGDFAIDISDPPPCTVGFLPPSLWRSPADTTTLDTPDGLYCKLPQDSPIAVRGARNAPCMGVPGKRAPTVEICNSNEPYQPLAMRQHSLGPYPFDPNLVGQGAPLDDRVTFGDQIFAPVPRARRCRREGGHPRCRPPAGAVANPAPTTRIPLRRRRTRCRPMRPWYRRPPRVRCPAQRRIRRRQAAPSASNGSTPSPTAAVAQYDPRTGRYFAPDGQLYQQTDVTAMASAPKTWQDMLPR